MRLKLKTWTMLFAAGCTAVSLSFSGTQFLLHRALEREARLSGVDWAHHMEYRLENADHLPMLQGAGPVKIMPSAEEIRVLVSDVFEIGHLYQFDFISVDCDCHISVSAVEAITDAAEGANADYHPAAAGAAKDGGTPASEKLRQLLSPNTAAQAVPKASLGGKHQYSVDRDLVERIVSRVSHDIIIRQNVSPYLPSTFAEVYHPVTDGTQVKYLLRILVNLDEQAALYGQFMLTAFLISILVLAIAVGYPTRRYVQAARHQRKADRRVEFLANHDVLTNLYNRNNFQETVSDIIWTCHEKRQSALLFVFDLNGFKEINDYHGHPVGDLVLCEFAALLRQKVPEGGYIARLGGDEFVVVIGGIEETNFKPSDYVDMPKSFGIDVYGTEHTVTASIAGGVARYPRDAQTTEELVQLADLALYAAKPNRSGEICTYVPQMKERFVERLRIRDAFRGALEASHVVPYYQPIVNMRTGIVESFEALARWNHPERGLLTPFVFADALEDGEICAQLGQLMFRKIVDDMSFWNKSAVPFNKVGLNVTDGDLKPAGFAAGILRGLEENGLAPSHLAIEVTENCLFGADKKHSLAHLEKLRDAGCSISLDDFGTGYSSITQLKELPITAIKIDKSFIDDVLENRDDQSIISAMLDLGKSMNFALVMEGIETSRQLGLLKFLGSELAQGYYFSRPMPAAEVPAFIERQNASYSLHGDLPVAS